MNLDTGIKFSTLLHNIAVTIALVTGSIWGYKTFIYENPAFNGLTGTAIYKGKGSVYIEASYKPLSIKKRIYEVRISIENKSKKENILINYGDVALLYKKVGNYKIKPTSVNYERISGENEGFWIPVNQKRSLTYLINLPDSGTYLVEFDYCTQSLSDCLVSRYIHSQ